MYLYSYCNTHTHKIHETHEYMRHMNASFSTSDFPVLEEEETIISDLLNDIFKKGYVYRLG